MEKIKKLEEIILAGAKCVEEDMSIKDTTNLIEDLGYDSLSMVQLIVDIECEFDIELDEVDIDELLNYSILKEYVLKNTATE